MDIKVKNTPPPPYIHGNGGGGGDENNDDGHGTEKGPNYPGIILVFLTLVSIPYIVPIIDFLQDHSFLELLIVVFLSN